MRIYITPRAGLSIRDPLQPDVRFPEAGDWREDKPAYRRLERSGDVTISDGPASAEAKSSKKGA